MADKPQITDLDEAKAALDAEIVDIQWWVDLYQRKVDEETVNLRRYQESLWRMKGLRSRMDPPAETPEASAAVPLREVA